MMGVPMVVPDAAPYLTAPGDLLPAPYRSGPMVLIALVFVVIGVVFAGIGIG